MTDCIPEFVRFPCCKGREVEARFFRRRDHFQRRRGAAAAGGPDVGIDRAGSAGSGRSTP